MGTGSRHQGKGMRMCMWKNVKVNIVLKPCTVAIEISHLARNNCTFTVQDIARALVGVRKGWYVKFAHLYSFELCYGSEPVVAFEIASSPHSALSNFRVHWHMENKCIRR